MADAPQISDGFWYTDIKDGTKKWQTGDMLLAMIRAEDGKKVGMKTIEAVVNHVADRLNRLQEENAYLHNRLILAEEKLGLPIRRLDDKPDRDEAFEAAKAARDRQRKAVGEPPALRSIK